MTVFLDTSVLFKLYFQEEGSAPIDAFFSQHSVDRIFISALASIEFRSIVWRKVRMKEVSQPDAAEIIRVFNDDLASFSIVAFDEETTRLASQLIDTYGLSGLRSLDALQLASAVAVRTQVTLYKTADRLLNDLFRAEGLPV